MILAGLLLLLGAEHIPLDGDWDFFYRPEMQGEIPALPPPGRFTCRMPVPGYWDDHLDRLNDFAMVESSVYKSHAYHSVDFPRPDYPPHKELVQLYGFGFYRKTIRVPEGEAVLHVGAARIDFWAWLNGKYLGHHRGGQSVPFQVPLTDAIRPGKDNELIVCVSNAHSSRYGLDVRSTQGMAAGIPRSVFIRVAGAVRIDDIFVHPDKTLDRLSWEASLAGKWEGATLEYSVGGSLKGTVSAKGAVVRWETATFGMEPWSDKSPMPYDIQVVVKKDGVVADSVVRTFGLRRLERDGHGLRLNGRPVMLRGLVDHFGYPVTVHPPSDLASYREMIRRYRQVGFNYIRFHTHVPSEEYMQAADELGMMLQVEPPVGYEDGEWRDIVRHCRRHPSVVLFCSGNEDTIDEAKIERFRGDAALVHEWAPGALYSPNAALRGVEYMVRTNFAWLGKDYVKEPYPHNPRRLAALKEYSDVFESCAWSHLSYISLMGDWKVLDERWKAFEKPILVHEVDTKGNFIDLDLEQRYEGRPGKPLFYTQLREKMRRAGLLHKAPEYYRNSCLWFAMTRKHCMELMRKSKFVAGFSYHTSNDIHWNQSGLATGLFNEFNELKGGESAEDILDYNGESVLLLDNTGGTSSTPVPIQVLSGGPDNVEGGNDRNLAAGETVGYGVMASLYGPEPLGEGEVEWHVVDGGGHVYARGAFPVRDVPNATVTTLGRVEFTAPESLHKSVAVTLHVRLSSASYELKNHWKYWFFPKSEPVTVEAGADAVILKKFGDRYHGLKQMGTQDLRVVSKLDESALGHLLQGGRVVLLGHEPLPAVATDWQIAWTGVYENLATVISDHAIMDGFPHEGWMDWQFYAMFRNARAVKMNDLNVPFDPIIDVVSGYKWFRQQSALFELRVGKGRLLVCSLNFPKEDPAAMCLLDRIVEYAPRFEPNVRADVGVLSRLLNVRSKVRDAIGGQYGAGIDPNRGEAQ